MAVAAVGLAGCGGGGSGGDVAAAPAPAPTPSPTAAVAIAQTRPPTLLAIPNVGRAASVAPGGYAGADGVSGQWLADDVPIAGATAATYAITAAEDGKVLGYRETATRAGAAALVTTVYAPVPVMPALAGPMLAEGDSAMEGVGASAPSRNWISQFAAAHDATLTNKGVGGFGLEDEYSGGTVSNARLAADAGATRYGSVVVVIGGNDVFQSDTQPALNPANFAAQLRQRMALLRLAGYSPADIVLGSLYPIGSAVLPFLGVTRATYEAFNATIRPIAQEFGVRFIDFYSLGNGVGDPADIAADGLHPNDAGYAALYRFALYNTTIPNRRPLPTGVAGSSPGAGQLTVSWTAAIAAGAAGAPIGYTVEREAGGTLAFTAATDTSGTGVTIGGLPAGSYRVRVRARYGDGVAGPWAFGSAAVAVP